MKITESRQRVIIEAVSPEVDDGRFPAKSIAGDTVDVDADIYADGHDTLSARLLYRREDEKEWKETRIPDPTLLPRLVRNRKEKR